MVLPGLDTIRSRCLGSAPRGSTSGAPGSACRDRVRCSTVFARAVTCRATTSTTSRRRTSRPIDRRVWSTAVLPPTSTPPPTPAPASPSRLTRNGSGIPSRARAASSAPSATALPKAATRRTTTSRAPVSRAHRSTSLHGAPRRAPFCCPSTRTSSPSPMPPCRLSATASALEAFACRRTRSGSRSGLARCPHSRRRRRTVIWKACSASRCRSSRWIRRSTRGTTTCSSREPNCAAPATM